MLSSFGVFLTLLLKGRKLTPVSTKLIIRYNLNVSTDNNSSVYISEHNACRQASYPGYISGCFTIV